MTETGAASFGEETAALGGTREHSRAAGRRNVGSSFGVSFLGAASSVGKSHAACVEGSTLRRPVRVRVKLFARVIPAPFGLDAFALRHSRLTRFRPSAV